MDSPLKVRLSAALLQDYMWKKQRFAGSTTQQQKIVLIFRSGDNPIPDFREWPFQGTPTILEPIHDDDEAVPSDKLVEFVQLFLLILDYPVEKEDEFKIVIVQSHYKEVALDLAMMFRDVYAVENDTFTPLQVEAKDLTSDVALEVEPNEKGDDDYEQGNIDTDSEDDESGS